MNVTTLDAVTYGVDVLSTAKSFWNDFGLALREEDASRLLFSSEDQSTVEVRVTDDTALPTANVPGPGVRESIFGVASEADLSAIEAELSKDRPVRKDADGTIHTIDPLGFGIGFRITRCRKVTAPDPKFNMPGRVGRLNGRGKFYKSANPLEMTHVVYMVTDTEIELDFYVRRLGFKVSDSYPRCGPIF